MPPSAARILLKFNLIFIALFGVILAAAAHFSWPFLQQGARQDSLRQARLMIQSMQSARDYTTDQIKPLLIATERHRRAFLPQTVPAFAATETFNYLRREYSDYSYKEATLNPTNPRDRATDWESDVIQNFRNHPILAESAGERETPNGRNLFIARPIVAKKQCLECHDVPANAPASLIHHYGTANGFGWKENEIVGAQIVSVPMAISNQSAAATFTTCMTCLGIILAAILVLLNGFLLLAIVLPGSRDSTRADSLVRGVVLVSKAS